VSVKTKGAAMRIGHKALASLFFLCVLAANDESRQLQTGEAAEAERESESEVQELPGGLQLREALPEGGIPIRVIPDWDLFLGFEDRAKLIRGKLTLSMFYFPEALNYVSDPQKIVSVDNFGAGDRYLQGRVSLVDPASNKDGFATSNIYVGDFSQSQSNFDHSCYPFDDKKVRFEISIQKPGNYIFHLELMCPKERLSEMYLDEKNKSRVRKCTGEAAGSYVGFDWGNFTCERVSQQVIMCSIVGIRQWDSIFKGHIWPSFIFSAMGFLSFALSVKMSMPRVATTMLALVSLTSLRNSVMDKLPVSGNTSWLEEYFLVSMTFMLLNLCGHAFSFYLDGKGKMVAQKMVNKINFYGMITIAFFVSMARLHERNCPLVDRTLSILLVVLGALLVVISFAVIGWIYRDARHEAVPILRSMLSFKSVKSTEFDA